MGIKSINLTSNQSINNVHHHHRNQDRYPCSCRQGASEGTTPPSLLQGDWAHCDQEADRTEEEQPKVHQTRHQTAHYAGKDDEEAFARPSQDCSQANSRQGCCPKSGRKGGQNRGKSGKGGWEGAQGGGEGGQEGGTGREGGHKGGQEGGKGGKSCWKGGGSWKGGWEGGRGGHKCGDPSCHPCVVS